MMAMGPRLPSTLMRPSSFIALAFPGPVGREPTATPAKHKSKLISRCPVEPFLEQYGSRFQRPVSGWLGMLNLSAYKALHPTWNQEPDLLHLAEGLEEQCQEGTLEHWALGRALEASEARDQTPETWVRIARASEDLVYSVSRGKPRAFKFVSANVTSWRPEIRQWLVSQHFDVALDSGASPFREVFPS